MKHIIKKGIILLIVVVAVILILKRVRKQKKKEDVPSVELIAEEDTVQTDENSPPMTDDGTLKVDDTRPEVEVVPATNISEQSTALQVELQKQQTIIDQLRAELAQKDLTQSQMNDLQVKQEDLNKLKALVDQEKKAIEDEIAAKELNVVSLPLDPNDIVFSSYFQSGTFLSRNLLDNNLTTFGHTDKNGLLKIQLRKKIRIKRIIIENRRDCCKDRLVGAKLDIMDGETLIYTKVLTTDLFEAPDTLMTLTINIPDYQGTSIVLTSKSDNVINIAEIKVMTYKSDIENYPSLDNSFFMPGEVLYIKNIYTNSFVKLTPEQTIVPTKEVTQATRFLIGKVDRGTQIVEFKTLDGETCLGFKNNSFPSASKCSDITDTMRIKILDYDHKERKFRLQSNSINKCFRALVPDTPWYQLWNCEAFVGEYFTVVSL